MLAKLLSRGWWMLLIRGIVAILFALLAFTRPGITLAALISLFGAFVLVSGAFAVWNAIVARKESGHWWVVLIEGLAGLLVGFIMLRSPGLTAIAVVFFIAAWAILNGLAEIIAAIRLRREIEGEWMLILAGIVSVLFGLWLAARPGAGALGMVWLIALFALVLGGIQIMLAFRVRSLAGKLKAATRA
jgi:uncharacterized membrane protein HdeD (DUF308 family)